MTNFQSDKQLPKPKVLEFESLNLSDSCHIVHVRQCQLSIDHGLWLLHAETRRWLHWSDHLGYWVPTLDGPSYWWDDRPWQADDLTPDETQKRFPGSIPVVAKVDKRMEAKRRKRRREEVIANTDVQTFDKPAGLPKGFGFTGDEAKRSYLHKTSPELHTTGRIWFTSGPSYLALYWLPGVDSNSRLAHNSKFFTEKNEAQSWLVGEIRKVEKSLRSSTTANLKKEEKQ